MPIEVFEDPGVKIVKIGPIGQFANNSYLIIDPATNDAALIDMPAPGEDILAAIEAVNIKSIVLTHTHPDHIGGYDAIKGRLGVPVYCHPAETLMAAEKIDVPLNEGDELTIGTVVAKVIHTPGHSPGSICLLIGNRLLAGDTLFPGGPGRSRTPEAFRQVVKSINERLYVLPDDTAVHPGHGADTTISASKQEYAGFAARPHPADLCGDVLWASS